MMQVESVVAQAAPISQSGPRTADTTLILAIAVWLVFNSHTENFHPMPWMAADGLLGNCLFYFASGYGIQASLKARHQPFISYFRRRVVRLYTPLVFIALASFAMAFRLEFGSEQVAEFIYPTPYTYVRVIIPFYILLWIFSRSTWSYVASIGAALVIATLTYVMSGQLDAGQQLVLGTLPTLVWDSFFWIVCAAGAMCARLNLEPRATPVRLFALGALCALYLALKFWLVVEQQSVNSYPLLLACVLMICLVSFWALADPGLIASIRPVRFFGPAMTTSAMLTLEIYLVHQPLTKVAALSGLVYPLNIIALAVLSLLVAAALGKLTRLVLRQRESPQALYAARR